MREKLRRQHNRNNVGHNTTNESGDIIVDSDTITIGTNEPLNQVMMRKRVLSRYHTALLKKRERKNKYSANYADETATEHSLNTLITTFDSNLRKNKQTSTSDINGQILQGKVCEYNLKSAKEVPMEDIEIEFEGINFDTSREDQQSISQGEDSVTTLQRLIRKIAEEAGVGILAKNIPGLNNETGGFQRI